MNWTTIKEALKSVKKEVVYGVLIALAVIFMVRSCTARRNNDRQARLYAKTVIELNDSITRLNNDNKLKSDTIKLLMIDNQLLMIDNQHLNKILKAKDGMIASKNETIAAKDKLIKSTEE